MMEQISQFIGTGTFTIAAQIAFFRKRRGLTQEQLAKLCSMGQPAIARLEQTPDTQWSIRTIARIAAALDVRVTADLVPNYSPPLNPPRQEK